MGKKTITLTVDGYEVTATFAETRNTEVVGHLKQILLASFVNNTSTSGSGILAPSSRPRYNQDGGTHCAP